MAVRSLLASLGFIAGIAVAAAFGSPALLCAAVGFASLAAVIAVMLPRSRFATSVVVAGLLALGIVRGGTLEPSPSEPRVHSRQLRELLVIGASVPGPTCRVRVRVPGGERTRRLELPDGLCPLSDGQRIRVLQADFAPEGSRLGGRQRIFATSAWVASEPRSIYWDWVARTRQHQFERSRADDADAFVVASTFGLRPAVSPSHKGAMRNAGLGHLLAVSGLHVALAGWAFRALFSRLGLAFGHRPALAEALAWLPMVAYVGLTGSQVPAVRAAVMIVALGLGRILGRPQHGVATLAVTLALMLAWEPGWVEDVGFQLSAAAMMAIATGEPRTGALKMHWRIAWWIAPVSLARFGTASLHGVLVNVVAVPLFSLWILPMALLGWAFDAWLGPLAWAPARAGARLLIDLANLGARVPASTLVGLAAAAGAALVIRIAARFSRGRLRAEGLRAWLPPWVPCFALVAMACLGPRPDDEPQIPRWLAIGGARSMALVTQDDRGTHCLRDPVGSPGWWLRSLPELGVDELSTIDAPPGPHGADLARRLADAGLYVPESSRCGRLDAAAVRRALDACRWRADGGRVIVRQTDEGGRIECMVEDRWVPLSDAVLLPSADEGAP